MSTAAHTAPHEPRGRSRGGRTTRRLRLPRALALVLTLVVLAPAAATAMPVEGYATYQPQTRCAPTPKAGTLALARWLQQKYPGTGSLGISRACGHGGVSEHKEGRAFDWAVDHSSARDRGYVKDLLQRLFATDKHGNHAALARRMGIMYLLWNDRSFAAYRGFEPKPYLSAGCSSKKKCSTTLRHRNHVHISLSRAGGKGRTSWYQHRLQTPTSSPRPRPKPTTGPPVVSFADKPYRRLTVPVTGETVVSKFVLEAGKTYKLTAGGLVNYGSRAQQVADAVCAWSPPDEEWRAAPTAAARKRHGPLGLRINGAARLGSTCKKNHTYRVTVTPKRTVPVRVRIAHRRAVGSGKLVLTVSKKRTDVRAALPDYPDLRPAPSAPTDRKRGYRLLGETIKVPADRPRGVLTGHELKKGARYRITVAGTVDLGRGVVSDGQCVRIGERWYRQASLDRRVPGADHGNLYVDGMPFDGRSAEGCGGHAHARTVTAARTGRLRLALWDPLDANANQGSLAVTVQRLTGIGKLPKPAPKARPRKSKPWRQGRDWLSVDAAKRGGTVSTMRLRKGQRVQVVVRGTQRSAGVTSDASCVATKAGWVPRHPLFAVADQDPLNLWVDGVPVRWRAVGPSDGCSAKHLYATTVTATKNGPLRVALFDLDHRDNKGAFEVTLLRES